MNRYVQQIPPKWWPPKLSPFWVRVWRPLRLRQQFRDQKIMEVDVRGLEKLRGAIDAGHGVMITPNHSGHADAHIMYQASDQVGSPLYFMTAWQVFQGVGPIGKRMLQHHGCFSIDREGTDLKAFRQASEVLQNSPYPLVIFPEGEVYHLNDRIKTFREGAAAVALSAAKRAKRDLVCVPCGIKYEYLDDPTPQLLELMDQLEKEIFWRPQPQLPLPERIYRFAEGVMALKEIEYLGRTSAGPLPERIDALAQHVLGQLERRREIDGSDRIIPERVKELRRRVLEQLNELSADDPARKPLEHELDDLFLVVQLYSYPGDYVKERPTIERMAETLDKFEEDVLDVYSASIRGRRRATVAFGDPIPVPAEKKKGAAAELTDTLEGAVQGLLDGIEVAENRFGTEESVVGD